MPLQSPDAPSWSWPAGRVLILYHWSWFEPAIGDVIVGWSRRDTLDAHGFVHLEEESTKPKPSITVDLNMELVNGTTIGAQPGARSPQTSYPRF